MSIHELRLGRQVHMQSTGSQWRITGSNLACLFIFLFAIPVQAGEKFWFGADLSYVNEMEDCGAVYEDGGERDPYVIFANHGANLARIRLWNDPGWTEYSDLQDVTRSLQRATQAGLKTLLNFHYSDDWADPQKQIIPAAWAEISDTDKLAKELYKYTFETLVALHEKGLLPEMVQVGNETNGEIMMAEPGQGYPIEWKRNARLLNAGISAVRDAAEASGEAVQVMLHVAQPENVEPWFEAAGEAGVTDFDLIGLSYYSKWSSRTMPELGETIKRLDHGYDADVILVETAYPWTLDSSDPAGNLLGEDSLVEGYPATREGQKEYLIDLTQLVIDNGGTGIVYWEPAWVSTGCSTRWGEGSHWENSTLFDFGKPARIVPGMTFMSHDYSFPAGDR